jgi:UDPglucose--hexose-1-phosphate uridylyltransferase
MHRLVLAKPDGRPLVLYARAPLPPDLGAPTPPGAAVEPNPHLRWHPLRAEWVAYAAHRQDRTFLPPPEWDPLAPTTDPTHPTELPAGPWEVAVFENRFPTLHPAAHDPPPSIVATAPGVGCCEVVVFTPDARGSLGGLPLDRITLLLAVWADRQRELGGRPGIAYVMPFENRGVEVGATLAHPHGQIYAYPFVPPCRRRSWRSSGATSSATASGCSPRWCAPSWTPKRGCSTRGRTWSPSFPPGPASRTRCGSRPGARSATSPGSTTPSARTSPARSRPC